MFLQEATQEIQIDALNIQPARSSVRPSPTFLIYEKTGSRNSSTRARFLVSLKSPTDFDDERFRALVSWLESPSPERLALKSDDPVRSSLQPRRSYRS